MGWAPLQEPDHELGGEAVEGPQQTRGDTRDGGCAASWLVEEAAGEAGAGHPVTVHPLVVAIVRSHVVRPGQLVILMTCDPVAVPRPVKKLFRATLPMAVLCSDAPTFSPVEGSRVSDVQK